MKKTVAIIGATGRVGSALAKCFSKTDNRLLLMSHNAEKLDKLIYMLRQMFDEADLVKFDCQLDCCWEADIIILAVPHVAEKQIAKLLKEVITQKIVISIANRLDTRFERNSSELSEAEELQNLLPYTKIVKAFNISHGTDFTKSVIPKDCFLAGDDVTAVKEVSSLIIPAGFNPILSGKLYQCRVLESTQTMLTTINTLHKNN